MSMANKDHYTYRVTWSPEDKEYVGICAEFPSLSWLAESQVNALAGIIALISDTVADMEANGEHVPMPLADKTYSGKFLVRVPPDTHRALAIKAAMDGVSLNRVVSEKLSNI